MKIILSRRVGLSSKALNQLAIKQFISLLRTCANAIAKCQDYS